MAKILIIDDSDSMRLFLEQVLTGAGHTVVATSDGRGGLAELQLQPFDLTITDIYMPDMDGIEMLRNARERRLLGRVIAISSKDSIVNLLPAARMLGARRTLHKPFSGEQLLAAVTETLAQPARAGRPPGSA